MISSSYDVQNTPMNTVGFGLRCWGVFFKQTCFTLKNYIWTKSGKGSREENLIPLLCEEKNPSNVDFALWPNTVTAEAASFLVMTGCLIA